MKKSVFIVVAAVLLSSNIFSDAFEPLLNVFFQKHQKIEGFVDDCCCEVEKVDRENSNQLNTLLSNLSSRRFFRYFRVNIEKECPFWVEQHICGLVGGCQVCECDDQEIPLPWKEDKTSLISPIRADEHDSLPYTGPRKDPWVLDDPNDPDATYVNLLLNIERNTGYTGINASRIWTAIYQENCFEGSFESLCLEERVFYRLISGMHTLVSTHISENYYSNDDGTYEPSVDEYQRRVLDHPDRVQNMYFAFLVLLRATHKAMPYLESYDYNTGDIEDDMMTKELMRQFASNSLVCSPTFDDTALFQSSNAEHMKLQFKSRFQNISRIIDCVSCQLCKIHGKLQILGLGTALKILMSEPENLDLNRNEVIALVNTLRKFSNAIHVYDVMLQKVEERNNDHLAYVLVTCFSVPLFLAISVFLVKNVCYHLFKHRPNPPTQR